MVERWVSPHGPSGDLADGPDKHPLFVLYLTLPIITVGAFGRAPVEAFMPMRVVAYSRS